MIGNKPMLKEIKMRRLHLLATSLIISGTALSGAANAAIVDVQTSAAGFGVEANVLLDPGECIGADAALPGELYGCFNGDKARLIRLASDGDSLIDAGGGQATLDSEDGTLDDLTLDLLNDLELFAELVLNIDATEDGTVFFPGWDPLPLIANGQNWFHIFFDPAVNEFSFSTTTDIIADIKQIRIQDEDGGGGGGIPTPEPAALGLFGLALIALASARRRRFP
jgi:PEP-CTERM motif